MTVREMLSRMDSYELTEWMVEYGMSPWGELRDDHRTALQTAHLMDVHRDRKKRVQPFQAKDFLLTFKEQEEEQPVIASQKTKDFTAAFHLRLFKAQNNRALKGAA